MLGIVGCLAAFLLVIYLCYKNVSIFVATILGGLCCILLNGLPILDTFVNSYLPGMAGFLQGYFLIFLFGAIQARIYVKSGAALSIAEAVMNRLMPKSTGANRRQVTAILLITLIGTVLAFGGILTTIVVILLYPIALAVFEQADIPKRFSLGILANGTYTFALTMPGSPQVTNIVPMRTLGTDASCALIPGIFGAVVEIVVMVLFMNWMINKAHARGEHFVYSECDERYDSNVKKPPVLLSLAPLILLFVLFNAFQVAIELCLALSVICALAVFFPYLKTPGVLNTINEGAVGALAPICTVGSVVGFAGIVTSTEAFQSIVDGILNIDAPPMLVLIVCTALLCALTGGSATGLTVCMPIIGTQMVEAFGISPAVIHRVSVFAATTIDTLPYSGAIQMFLPISGMKLKDVYPPAFITTVVSTTAGTVAVALLCMIPGLS